MSLEYSEYKAIEDLLTKSNQDNVYEKLMKKEEKTLEAVDKVIKYYTDNKVKKNELASMTMMEIIVRFATIWTQIISEVMDVKYIKDIKYIFIKEDRLIYIGFMVILISLFVFLANI